MIPLAPLEARILAVLILAPLWVVIAAMLHAPCVAATLLPVVTHPLIRHVMTLSAFAWLGQRDRGLERRWSGGKQRSEHPVALRAFSIERGRLSRLLLAGRRVR